MCCTVELYHHSDNSGRLGHPCKLSFPHAIECIASISAHLVWYLVTWHHGKAYRCDHATPLLYILGWSWEQGHESMSMFCSIPLIFCLLLVTKHTTSRAHVRNFSRLSSSPRYYHLCGCPVMAITSNLNCCFHCCNYFHTRVQQWAGSKCRTDLMAFTLVQHVTVLSSAVSQAP